MKHLTFNLESKQSARSRPVLSAKQGSAWLLQTLDNESPIAERLRVFVALLLQSCSCIITSSRSLCCICQQSLLVLAYCTCMYLYLVHVQSGCLCVCVSHNSTTVGQRVQPSCSLSGRSVSWYTNLIHFALTLTLALTLNSLSLSLFRVNINTIMLHFCCTRCCVNVLCCNTG